MITFGKKRIVEVKIGVRASAPGLISTRTSECIKKSLGMFPLG
jgi:hypothetical protein